MIQPRPRIRHHLHCFKYVIDGHLRYGAKVEITDGSDRDFRSDYNTLDSMVEDLAARLKKVFRGDNPVQIHRNLDLKTAPAGSERLGVPEFGHILDTLRGLVPLPPAK